MAQLDGMKIAILAAEGFEQAELLEPKKALEESGAETLVVSPAKGEVQGWKHFDKGAKVKVDVSLDQADASEFDALLLPGGVANPDQLRTQPRAVQFVRDFFEAGKPVAVICHGPWTLIEADVVRDRTITSWPSLKTDLRNAGATWVDQEVVVDAGLVSSRKPQDIPAFNRTMIETFAGARQTGGPQAGRVTRRPSGEAGRRH
ncbi:MAG TPA: type 1 glutamine amidotransferase domain-containing protein [Steroidobacteraceae bacterium]|nr:type 1 glutamine amidotransferase domain-containing protein [Steroidobacteraceae bacterium]